MPYRERNICHCLLWLIVWNQKLFNFVSKVKSKQNVLFTSERDPEEVNIEASTMFSDSYQMPCWHVWADIRVRCVGDFFPFWQQGYTFLIVPQDDILWLNSSTISKAERNQINHLQKKMCGFVLKATNQQSRKSGTRFCGQLCQWWNTKICIKDASMHFCEKKS